MRILYSFPFAIGAPGIGTTALYQVLGLLERGHQVTVMATSADKRAPRLPDLRSTLSLGGVRLPHRVFGMDRTMAFHDAQVAGHLRQQPDSYDVVHCWPSATLATARVAAEIGVPSLREVPNTHTENAYEVVGQLCAGLGIELPPGSSDRFNADRLARMEEEYQAAFRLLLPSERVAETFRVRGFAEGKLMRHRYGFDPKVFIPPAAEADAGPLRALFLGSVGPRKGLHVALQAWARSEASKDGRFAIYGRVEDTYRPIIEPLLAAPGVELHEFTSNVGGVLQDSDVLLLPSFEEGSALVTYEAQGCGVIPLVSDAAGAMCTHGVTGLVHHAGDAEALAQHLDSLAHDPERRRAMRQAVLDQRDSLTWLAAAETLEACYESARADLRPAPSRVRSSSRPVEPAAKTPQAQPPLEDGAIAGRDLVFTFWRDTWLDAVVRGFMTPDRLIQALLVRPEVGGLLIANPFRSAPSQILRNLQGRGMPPLPAREHPTGLTTPLRLRRQDGLSEASLRRTYEDYDRHLKAEARRLGLRNPAVITTNPFYAAFGPADWCGPITYYAWDDWAAFEDHAPWWPAYTRAYSEIRRRGHAVCAVSQHLLNRIDPLGPGLVVPNGIVPEEWEAPWQTPDWLEGLPRPLIVYTGAIHSRLDLDAVRQLSARFPGGSIVFVGPNNNAEVAHQLAQIPRVQWHDSIHRPLVAGLTRAADVCIMPHHLTPLTESMSPLKIYEYVAAGGPAAATDIGPVRNIHPSVVLVPPGGSFADGVERALRQGPMAEDDRQQFIRQNSWRGRHDAILALAMRDR
jgi:glycosyltransferase involved in cell wall biosynthesis